MRQFLLLMASAQIFLVVCVGAVGAAGKRSTIYDRAVNETLDMTLLVGAEMRSQHPTWQQIQNEVARRLHVVRVEPWNAPRK